LRFNMLKGRPMNPFNFSFFINFILLA
jgi:hypothetical protein